MHISEGCRLFLRFICFPSIQSYSPTNIIECLQIQGEYFNFQPFCERDFQYSEFFTAKPDKSI